MKRLLMILPLVFLLCFAFSCRQGEDVAKLTLEQTKIVFSSYRDGNLEIYVMNADGSEQTRLTDSASEQAPSWSPDGKKIAFYSLRNDVPGDTEYGKDERAWYECNAEIYIMNSDGSEQKNITNNPAYDGYPFWSPFLKTGKKQLGMELKH
jgi:Tol biopolymer transport system component